ncbi:hypothetical protein MTR67_048410 [Solanum verrucosum]|uniref:Uncharacterized protein n=1 Tax=Solanum verrucosum TaxID=315347 RepID=A0AAF0ZZJ7_SOLVR|nr:hypothetical protein MTR67_048410 [Solanum verrucosum]
MERCSAEYASVLERGLTSLTTVVIKTTACGGLGGLMAGPVWNHRRQTPGKERCGWMEPPERDAGKEAMWLDGTTGERERAELTPTQ